MSTGRAALLDGITNVLDRNYPALVQHPLSAAFPAMPDDEFLKLKDYRDTGCCRLIAVTISISSSFSRALSSFLSAHRMNLPSARMWLWQF